MRSPQETPSPLYRQPPPKGKAAPANGQRLSRLSEYDVVDALAAPAAAAASAGQLASRLAAAGHVDPFLEDRKPDRPDHRLVADHIARRAVEPHRLGDLEALGQRGLHLLARHVLLEARHVEA